jgi:hypothetical protein
MPVARTITLAQARESFLYCESSGSITCLKTGKKLGIDKRGSLRLEGRTINASRLAILLADEVWPINIVNHVDGDKTNIKYDNIALLPKHAHCILKRRGGRLPCSYDLSAMEVRQLINYDRTTGALTWRYDRSSRAKKGQIAGGTDANGYRTIQVNGTRQLATRVAYVLVRGKWPLFKCTFIDKDRENLKWENLRFGPL